MIKLSKAEPKYQDWRCGKYYDKAKEKKGIITENKINLHRFINKDKNNNFISYPIIRLFLNAMPSCSTIALTG